MSLFSHTKVIIVSCLSNIVKNLATSSDAKVGIERAMLLIGNQFHEISRLLRGAVRIFVGPCLSRSDQNYSTHAKFAMVSKRTSLFYLSYLSKFGLLTLRCSC